MKRIWNNPFFRFLIYFVGLQAFGLGAVRVISWIAGLTPDMVGWVIFCFIAGGIIAPMAVSWDFDED